MSWIEITQKAWCWVLFCTLRTSKETPWCLPISQQASLESHLTSFWQASKIGENIHAHIHPSHMYLHVKYISNESFAFPNPILIFLLSLHRYTLMYFSHRWKRHPIFPSNWMMKYRSWKLPFNHLKLNVDRTKTKLNKIKKNPSKYNITALVSKRWRCVWASRDGRDGDGAASCLSQHSCDGGAA